MVSNAGVLTGNHESSMDKVWCRGVAIFGKDNISDLQSSAGSSSNVVVIAEGGDVATTTDDV